ncbi:MAG: YeeE/YedE family protein [Burkholderiaceae bacterium]|jgi:uncharacterized membrane protein YedE/YeeE
MSHVELTLWASLAIGLVFGATGQISGFCLYRGLRHAWTGHSGDKLRSFGLALAVAILGTQLAAWAGLIDLSESIYVNPSFSWLLIPLGGIVFGYGMTLANGCGARALVLLGQGNLRSFVVLLCLGIVAFITLTGLLAPTRMDIANATPVSVEGLHGLSGDARLLFALVIVAALLYAVFRNSRFVRNRTDLIAGLVVGLVIVAGWLATGVLGFDDFEPMALTSITFVAPVGETIQYAMIATGMKLSFGIAVVVGVVAGALVTALVRGKFRLEGFDNPQTMLRYMSGGALMGLGGALAMGCSIGQGLTGLSTLGTSSILAAAGIVIGTRLAVSSPLRVPDLTLPKRVGDT